MNFWCWFIVEWRMTWDTLNLIHKSHPPRSFDFHMFHCSNISKHISVSMLFFIISISCFVFFCWIFKNNCPGGGVLELLFCHTGRGFHFLCALGVGNSPFQKVPGALSRRGMFRLGIDSYMMNI